MRFQRFQIDDQWAYHIDFSDEISRGMLLLDAFAPGWESQIDTAILRLEDGNSCILGQVLVQNRILAESLRLDPADLEVDRPFTPVHTSSNYAATNYRFMQLHMKTGNHSPLLYRRMAEIEEQAGTPYNAMRYGFYIDEMDSYFDLPAREFVSMYCENRRCKHNKRHGGPGCLEHRFTEEWGYELLAAQWIARISGRLRQQRTIDFLQGMLAERYPETTVSDEDYVRILNEREELKFLMSGGQKKGWSSLPLDVV